MVYFTFRDRRLVQGSRLVLAAQAPPPLNDTDPTNNDPCVTGYSSQGPPLIASKAYIGRQYAIWINRANLVGSSRAANPINNTAGPNHNAVALRSTGIPFKGSYAYLAGQLCYDPGTAKNYVRNTSGTSASTFADDASNWTDNATLDVPLSMPQRRVEYTTLSLAQASVKAQSQYMRGVPEFTDAGDGWGDICTTYGMAYYLWDDQEAARDTLYVSYPSNPDTSTGAIVNVAVCFDTVILPYGKLTDIWEPWVNSGANAVGDIRKDTDQVNFWWCATAHTSAASGTFAQDRAGAAVDCWKPIEIDVLCDWEPQDSRPLTAATDSSPDKDANSLHLMSWICPRLTGDGYGVCLYTNTFDTLGPLSSNGLGEANMDAISQYFTKLYPIVSGSNRRGNDIVADAAVAYRRARYVNADPAQGDRAHWDPKKMGLGVEMVWLYGNRSFPVVSIAVGAAPDYKVTITSPGQLYSAGLYALVSGSLKPEWNGLYGAINSVSRDHFNVASKVTNINRQTGEITTVPFSGQGMPTYTGGAVVNSGGSTYADFVRLYRWMRAHQIENLSLWNDFADMTQPTLDGPSFAIEGVTNDSPAVVTAPDHGMTAADLFVTLIAMQGNETMNDICYPCTVIDDDHFALTGFAATNPPVAIPYDSTLVSPYTGGGFGFPTRRRGANRKKAMLAFGRGVPRMMV